MAKARAGSSTWGGIVNNTGLSFQQVDVSNWEAPDEGPMADELRDHYLRRRGAITDYLDGKSDQYLKENWNLGRAQARRLIVERCLQTHPDGKLWGWRGALPNVRVNPWTRQTPPTPSFDGRGGNNGVLQWLLASPEHAGLKEEFKKKILEKSKGLRGTRTPKLKLFEWFIAMLREAGRERRREWPFDSERLGYSTISKYITKVRNENPEKRRELEGGADAERKARAGDGTNRPDLRLFERVECDAHKLDIRMVVMVPSPHGGYEPRKIYRLWVIVLIEVTTRAVLGYYLSLRREVAAEDVLRAVQNALSQWGRRKLQFSDRAYSEEAALPSARDSKYLGACWDEFSVDGALANVCNRVKDQLARVVGAKVLEPGDPNSYSSRRSKDDRPFIESFFKTLGAGARGLHGLSPSTKSSPADLKGDGDPAKKAEAVLFQVEYLQELLDVTIANYNATPHSGLGYRSPLQQMDFLSSQRGARIRTADPAEVARLGAIRRQCTLLGGADTGRRPYFNFENARYSSEALVHRPDLLGRKLWLTIENPDDARWATVTDDKGLFICNVRAAPPWHRTPHSLYVRQAIRALERRRLLHLSSNCDAVEELIKYSETTRDKKLPVHAAYATAREIMKNYADNLAHEPILAKPESKEAAPQQQTLPTVVGEQMQDSIEGKGIVSKPLQIADPASRVEEKDKGPSAPSSKLPQMRKARTW